MKRIICILAAMSAMTISFAQSFLESVTLSVDKGLEGVYAKGETIKVFAESGKDIPALLKIYENGMLKEKKEISVPAGKSEIYSASYDRAAALMFRLTNPEKLKDSTTVGAIVAPEEFQPGFEEPADFRKFWDAQIKKIRKQKIKASLVPVEVPEKYEDDFVCYDLEVNCAEGGAPVRGYLALPRGAEAKSLPIAIFAHSAGLITKSWTHSTVERAIKMAKYGNGAIGLDINAHGLLNAQDESYYEQKQEELKDYARQHPITDHEMFYFRGMFLRMVRALDYLCTLKEWDGKTVLVTGGSQGGAQSAALAGLDSRVTHVVVDVPAMWDMGGILAGRTSAWGKHLEREGVDSPAAKIVPYYDASNFLRYYKGELVVNVGLIDMTCPPAGVWSVYNVCPAAHKEIHPCAWKGHSAKYSVPGGRKDELKKHMGAFLEDAINGYLK